MATTTRSVTAKLAAIPPRTGIGLAIALLGLPTAALATRAVAPGASQVAEIGVQWAVAVLVVGVTVGVEGNPPASLGLRRPAWRDLGYLLGTSVAALAVFVAADPLVEGLGLAVRDGGAAIGTGAGLGVALAGAVTVGVVEELLYRGYAVERLLEYTGSPLLAGGLSVGVFTAAHATYWPAGSLLKVAVVTGLLTAVYLRRRTLVPVAGAHVLVWTLAVLGQFYG